MENLWLLTEERPKPSVVKRERMIKAAYVQHLRTMQENA